MRKSLEAILDAVAVGTCVFTVSCSSDNTAQAGCPAKGCPAMTADAGCPGKEAGCPGKEAGCPGKDAGCPGKEAGKDAGCLLADDNADHDLLNAIDKVAHQ